MYIRKKGMRYMGDYNIVVSEEELLTLRNALHQSISVNVAQSLEPFQFSRNMLETIQRELRDDTYFEETEAILEKFKDFPEKEQREIIENLINHISSERRKDIKSLLDNLEYNENL